MSLLELEKLVESLSDAEKTKLRELLDSSARPARPAESHPDLSWLDELQAEARAACEAEGARLELPADLAATFRQRKRDSLFGPYEPRE